ncbi:MAG: class I SAM-dependent methyltransferase [Lachnospiraceae bacterium]
MRPCIACRMELPEESLFQLEQAPASAQDIPDENTVKTDQGIILQLHQCSSCGLVQFACTPVAYYRDVIRAGGFSTTMTNLRRRQYSHLIKNYQLEHKKFIEVGCGRGEFLQVLKEFPVEAYGIEHSEELVQIAVQNGLNVTCGFTETAGQDLGEQYDVFLSFNFLEHQPDPDIMLQAIYHNLSEDGMGMITVPSLEYILEQESYYELIRDHIAYYSFDTLRTLLERNGFAVLEEEMVNRDTIAMIVRKMPLLLEQNGLPPQVKPLDISLLSRGYRTVQEDVLGLLARLAGQGKKAAIWGASHQGFTLAGTLDLGNKITYIIDSAPFKQGKFAPASHLRIVAPEHIEQEPVDAIIIVAPGYTDEIAGIIRERFGSKIEIFTLRTSHIEIL